MASSEHPAGLAFNLGQYCMVGDFCLVVPFLIKAELLSEIQSPCQDWSVT